MNRNVSEKDQSIKSCGAIPAPVSTNNPLGLTGWGQGVGTVGGVGVRGIRGVRVGDCVHTYLLMLLATL